MLSMWRLALAALMVGLLAIGCGGADESSSTGSTGGSSGAGGTGGSGANGEGGNAEEVPPTYMPDGTPVCPSGMGLLKKDPPTCSTQASVIEDASVPDTTPPPGDASVTLDPDATQCLDLEGVECAPETCTLTRYTRRPNECRWDCLNPDEEMGKGLWPQGASERLVTNRCNLEVPDAGP